MIDNGLTEVGHCARYTCLLPPVEPVSSFRRVFGAYMGRPSRVINQRYSESPDVITIEDLVEAQHPLGYDAGRAEWALSVVKSYGTPRQALGVLLLRLRDDGQMVLRLE